MKIENQVCSLEQAKRLKQLGIEHRSYTFKWVDEGFIPFLTDRFNSNWSNDPRMVVDVIEEYAAFTVAELGVMLPPKRTLSVIIDNNQATVIYWPDQMYHQEATILTENDRQTYNPTEAQARAAMLIYLLENNHITAEEVNNRLQSA